MPYEIPDSDSNPIWVPDRSQATYYVFSFAYDDVGLENGLTVYTPSVGDGTVFLLDAALIVDVGFDGTTPKLDLGTGVDSNYGILADTAYAWELADADYEKGGIQVGNTANKEMTLSASDAMTGAEGYRTTYLPFTATNPLKMWVSQNSQKGGTAVGGTAGAGRLVFSIVTPEAAPG